MTSDTTSLKRDFATYARNVDTLNEKIAELIRSKKCSLDRALACLDKIPDDDPDTVGLERMVSRLLLGEEFQMHAASPAHGDYVSVGSKTPILKVHTSIGGSQENMSYADFLLDILKNQGQYTSNTLYELAAAGPAVFDPKNIKAIKANLTAAASRLKESGKVVVLSKGRYALSEKPTHTSMPPLDPVSTPATPDRSLPRSRAPEPSQ